jgi:hypothetical protein
MSVQALARQEAAKASEREGQMAAVILSADAVADEARAIQALVRAGFRAAAIMADLDAALALARDWSAPVARAA